MLFIILQKVKTSDIDIVYNNASLIIIKKKGMSTCAFVIHLNVCFYVSGSLNLLAPSV